VESLAPFAIDLHQVRNPLGFSPVESEMRAMADLVAGGRIRAVGVNNFNAVRLRRAHAALTRHRIPLASNQVRYSLLDRRVEQTGILAAAKELGVTIIASSPLEQGLLTGRYHEHPKHAGARPWPLRLASRLRLEQAVENCQALDLVLSPGDLHRLDEVSSNEARV
jgi:aryl-alcohol dehydrogenase-like predicted oxidoreductase